MFGRATITLGIGPHSSFLFLHRAVLLQNITNTAVYTILQHDKSRQLFYTGCILLPACSLLNNTVICL